MNGLPDNAINILTTTNQTHSNINKHSPSAATSSDRTVQIHDSVINKNSFSNESLITQTTPLPTNTPLIKFGIQKLPHAREIEKAVEILDNFHSLGILKEDSRTEIRYRNGHVIANNKIQFSHSLKIPFISDLTMASLANYYKQKYAVDISIVITKDNESFIDYIEESTNGMQPGNQKGLIIRIGEDTHHVTPIIIQRTHEKTDIIVLDSVDCLTLKTLIRKINPENSKNTRIIILNHIRQADNHSCRSDAILILKDALRFKDPMSLIKSKSLTKDPFKISNGCAEFYCSEQLPAPLSKTLQRRSMIEELTSSEDYNISIRCSASTKLSPKTMKTHLQKYSRTIETTIARCHKDYIEETPGNWRTVWRENKDTQEFVVNLYLQTKAHILVGKAFSQLDDGEGCIAPAKKEQLLKEYVIHYEKPKTLLKSTFDMNGGPDFSAPPLFF